MVKKGRGTKSTACTVNSILGECAYWASGSNPADANEVSLYRPSLHR